MSRRKGATFERTVRKLAEDKGLDAKKLSSMQAGDSDEEFSDLRIEGLRVECRNRNALPDWPWKDLEGKQSPNDILVLKKNGTAKDPRPPLAVVRLEWLLDLIAQAKGNSGNE